MGIDDTDFGYMIDGRFYSANELDSMDQAELAEILPPEIVNQVDLDPNQLYTISSALADVGWPQVLRPDRYPSDPDEVAGQMGEPPLHDNLIQCSILRPDGTPADPSEYGAALAGSDVALDRQQTELNGGVPIVAVPDAIWHELESGGRIAHTLPSGYKVEAEMP